MAENANDPTGQAKLDGIDLAERLGRHLDTTADPDECWPWIGSRSVGYGYLRVAGVLLLAHRVAYELFVGPIPPGLDVDHTCHNRAVDAGQCLGGNDCPHRACCNPAHLEPVTRGENIRRGARRATGFCGKGHGDDDLVRRKTTGQIIYCKACARAKRAAARATRATMAVSHA